MITSKQILHYTNSAKDKVKLVGIDCPIAEVLTKNDEYVMIKIPGHSYWVGRGMKRQYQRAEIVVYKIIEEIEKGLRCVPVIAK